MKHIFFFSALTLMLMVTFHPQKTLAQPYTKSVSGDPISLAWGVLNATYEQRVGNENSFTVFGSFWSFKDWQAFGIGGSYRWYFDLKDGKKPLQGLSAGPLIALASWKYGGATTVFNYEGGVSIALGGELAYKWVLNHFVIEPILRLAFNVRDIRGLDYRAVGLGVNLGYAW